MIVVYYTVISEVYHEQLLKKHLPKYSTDFREKINNYKRLQDAQSSLLGRLLLSNATMSFTNNVDNIKYTDYQKPYFENLPYKFNISHSGEVVICAFSNKYELGIDIEEIKDIELDVFKDQMTENEWKAVMQAEAQKEAFYEYWTKKEAVIKAHGKGLSLPLKSFEITENRATIDNKPYCVNELEVIQGYSCSLAVRTFKDIIKHDIIIKEIDLIAFL